MEETIDYEKLRLDVLRNLIEGRGISPRGNKKEIIEDLILDDKGKYLKETTYEKSGNGFIVGIPLNNGNQLRQVGELLNKKEAINLNRYDEDRVHFRVNQKLI